MKLNLLPILFGIACTSTPKAPNPLQFGERLKRGEEIHVYDNSSSRYLDLNPYYFKNLGRRAIAIKDRNDPYNVIPFLVLDDKTEAELFACSEPLKGDCLKLFRSLIARLDWPYVIAKKGDTLSSVAAKNCGGSHHYPRLRELNFPYGECEVRVDRLDGGLCKDVEVGAILRIPPSCED